MATNNWGYSVDFETTTDPDDCRVWAFGACDISINPSYYKYGNSIEAFFKWLFELKPSRVYFHNLKFDGNFILNWLFKNGFTHHEDKRTLSPGEFATLISDDLKFYSITICIAGAVQRSAKIEIRDSLKLLTMTAEEISKTYGLEDKKLKIDYDEYREPDHELTQDEIDYIHNDITIVAKGLSILFAEGLNRLTTGSNALAYFKSLIGMREFFRRFPPLETVIDDDLRQAYKGGFTFLNPKFAGRIIDEGIVLDVNSLYPWAMHSPNKLPYGRPIYFDGEYEYDKLHPLYIQRLTCQFDLKPDGIPCIQLKNSRGYEPTEYLTTSNITIIKDGKKIVMENLICLTVTNIDLELIKDNYELKDVTYHCGWKFRAATGLFDGYIDYWMEQKIKASKEGNKGLRAISKLMLNSLYGKFATSPYIRSAIPYLTDKGIKFKKTDRKERDKNQRVYLPTGEFITAIARDKTIRTAKSCYDRFIYADTDSCHIVGTTIPDNIDVDDFALGAWKHESTFTKAKFLRAKTYIEEIDGKLKVTVAGLPKAGHKYITFDNFNEGAVFEGKLTPKSVDGGVVLMPTTFKIKG